MTNHSGPIVARRDNLTAIDCKSCGYIHLDQYPDSKALSDYYKSDFWQKDKPDALADFERQAEWWAAVHGDWLSCVEAHVGYKRTLLDVGCGYVFFMKHARDRSWQVDGIEPNAQAIAYAEKTFHPRHILYGTWEDWGQPSVSTNQLDVYDCISAHWLIEHLPNPLKFLVWAKSHLAPGGVLLAAIPQEWTEAQAAANEITQNKNWFIHETHLNYFSQASFANLLGRSGFRIVDMLATHAMEDFIISKELDYTVNPDLGRRIHAEIEKGEVSMSREQRLKEYRARAFYGRGRDLICICRKD